MSTSRNDLENVGRERYMVKDVKAKVQVGRISKELKVIRLLNFLIVSLQRARSLGRKNYGSAELENLLDFAIFSTKPVLINSNP